MTNNFPALSEDFFSVCQTAIKSAAWKYEDFVRVKGVEGELEVLRAYVLQQSPVSTTEIPAEPGQGEELEPKMINHTQDNISSTGEPIRASKDETTISTTFVTPEDAKKAPIRPMPQEILDLVKVGVEVAKNPPKVREVKVESIPDDPDAARNAWNKPF